MAPITLLDDLRLSSNELDSRSTTSPSIDLPSYLSSLTIAEREALNAAPASSNSGLHKRAPLDDVASSPQDLSPMAAHHVLTARSQPTSSPNHAGAVPPDALNMKGIQALFALIGASFVLGSIWFFFWAKNGGFRWKKNDWDDYKSTVLRRKGPDGKTLSNATKSTKLGGGSIVDSRYKDFADDERSLGMTELTKTTSGNFTAMPAGKRIKKMRERMAEKKARKAAASNLKRHVKDTERQARNRSSAAAGVHSEGTAEGAWEGGADNDVRAYRHEKPARVGGLNKESDARHYGTDYSETDGASSHNPIPSYNRPQRHSRQSSPEKHGSRDGTPRASTDRYRPSGQNQYRTSRPKQSPAAAAASAAGRRSMPGSFGGAPSEYGGTQDSQGTKSYHHPIPGLSGNRGPGGGFRREGRRDSFDSD